MAKAKAIANVDKYPEITEAIERVRAALVENEQTEAALIDRIDKLRGKDAMLPRRTKSSFFTNVDPRTDFVPTVVGPDRDVPRRLDEAEAELALTREIIAEQRATIDALERRRELLHDPEFDAAIELKIAKARDLDATLRAKEPRLLELFDELEKLLREMISLEWEIRGVDRRYGAETSLRGPVAACLLALSEGFRGASQHDWLHGFRSAGIMVGYDSMTSVEARIRKQAKAEAIRRVDAELAEPIPRARAVNINPEEV